jgi:hypothetical protein
MPTKHKPKDPEAQKIFEQLESISKWLFDHDYTYMILVDIDGEYYNYSWKGKEDADKILDAVKEGLYPYLTRAKDAR